MGGSSSHQQPEPGQFRVKINDLPKLIGDRARQVEHVRGAAIQVGKANTRAAARRAYRAYPRMLMVAKQSDSVAPR
jgi:hypothetical protein